MINKNRKTLQILFLIKDLDPIFFEFLIDNIEYPNKKLTFTKNENLKTPNTNIILFFIYCNVFSTKQLNLQLQNKPTVDTTKDNLLYYINKGKRRIIAKILNNDLKQQLQKSFFLSISQTKYDETVSSKILTSSKTLQNFNFI
uniref:Uncharacterized protein n=1 Tax=Saccharina subsessilis TaxID=2173147 RepID=A0A8F0F9N3_9PHAE|nr:hypothetical protein [Saccharina subsessilis]